MDFISKDSIFYLEMISPHRGIVDILLSNSKSGTFGFRLISNQSMFFDRSINIFKGQGWI